VTDTNVFRLSQAGTFTDPLSEVLRNGARSASGATVELRFRASSAAMPTSSPIMAAGDWCAAGICPSVRS
jgi:hypothetical protein